MNALLNALKKHKNACVLTAAILALLLALILHLPQNRTERLHPPIHPGENEGVLIHQGVALIDINHASEILLMTLPGIGEKLARAIVHDRETHGPFDTPSALTRVPGIGSGKLKTILPHITCGLPTP